MFKYEEICNIEQDFYNLFEPKNGIETEKSYKIKNEILSKCKINLRFSSLQSRVQKHY